MTKFGRFHAGVLSVGVLVLATACNETRDTGAVTSKSGGKTTSAPPAETVEKHDMALIRVVNAIPGGAPITIWAGDSAAFASVAYKTATKYRQIPDNMFNFKLRAGTGSASEPLAENRENLNDGGHYTVVAMPDQGGADKRNLRVLDDELKPVPANKARVRFINAVPSDIDVDLYMRGHKAALFDGVNFKSEAGWNEVDPMSGTFEVKPDNKDNVLATLTNVKLDGAKSYTFILSGHTGKYDFIKVEDDVAQAN